MNGFDARRLYPIQKQTKSKLVVFDEREEDDHDDESENSKPRKFSPPKKTVSLGVIKNKSFTPPPTRRSSTDQSISKNGKLPLGQGRFPVLPPSSVAGPNGRRQSAYIDYEYFNNHIANKSKLVAQTDGQVTKTGAAMREASEAIKQVRLQGILQFNKAASLMTKLFWLLLFLVCMIILIHEICKAVGDYRNKPLTTTFTIRTPASIRFPQIYICMGNALNRSYVREHPEAVLGIQNVYQSITSASAQKTSSRGDSRRKRDIDFEHHAMSWDQQQPHDQIMRIFRSVTDDSQDEHVEERWRRSTQNQSEIIDQWNKNGEIAYDFLKNAGFNVKDTFLNCTFRGYKTRAYDCSKIVRTVLDPNYFLCYLIDIPDEENQVMPNKGLELLINSQVGLYPKIKANDTKPNGYAGIQVNVHDQLDVTNWYKNNIRPGTMAKLTISATHVQLINMDRGSSPQLCVEDGTELYRIFNLSSYSRTACQMDCQYHAFYQHCNCIWLTDKQLIKPGILAEGRFCAFADVWGCLIPNVTKNQDVQNAMIKCRNRCNTPCDSMRFQMRSSQSPLNPGAFANSKIPVGELIKLDIAFGKLEISELVQSYSKTLAQMIADAGGHVNLWLGASIITLVEIPLFLVGYCTYRAYHMIIDAIWCG